MSGKGNNRKKAVDGATVNSKKTAKIVVAASAASTSPPTDAGSKPSTIVDRTPTKRTKRKQKTRIPPTPGFTSKAKNAKSLQKVQRAAPKEDLDTTKVERAATLFKKQPSQRPSR